MSLIINKIKKYVDNYLRYAFIIDVIVICILWFLNSNFSIIDFQQNDKKTNLDLINNIIGASISLAGFILASLTIIVAIRSNIKSKSPEQAETPLELFFSVGTFKTIVKVFRIAILELVICFVVSYVIWMISNNLSNGFIFNLLVSIIFLMSVSTIRSLFVLFLLIDVGE
ncbi:hypothetical protein C8N46_10218 [Kordia periserrulae]|uniref:Uncharacterized protein n=1 Tax=Kordia periserrulae TaxID=701523 RepID=A0A2T6C2V1_9FLAO|nr:hypothetical protein [Kordia periserrulae]PTX62623.1 hypothetical protein C8N46_10218 [Kordia periserrulae]